jgi:hypothetical protein
MDSGNAPMRVDEQDIQWNEGIQHPKAEWLRLLKHEEHALIC